MRIATHLAVAVCAAAVVGCSDDGGSIRTGGFVPAPVVSSVTVAPPTVSLEAGVTSQLSATARDASGATISGRGVTWSSANASIASVSAAGVVTGVAAGGPVAISATIDGRVGTSQVSVTAPPVSSVTVSPPTASIPVGGGMQLSASVRDAAGSPIAGRVVTWSSSNTALATISSTGLVSGVSVGGPVTITATSGGVQGNASVSVTQPNTSAATITVDGAQLFQTMTGWEALAEIGQAECDPRAYATFKNNVLDRAANELGINRIRIALRNGYENPVDQFIPFQVGQLTFNQWKVHWFRVVNDNDDPFVMNPAGFNWGYLDYTIDELVIPLKQRLAARGEGFWLNLVYVGANSGDVHRNDPEEYAELALAAFQHLQARYGWVPNSLEVVNEPNLGTWNGTHVGQALVAAKRRLNQAGFFPQFVGPSVSQVTPSLPFFDQMMMVQGASQALNEFSYHRYGTKATANQLRAIAQRAATFQVRTAMLEHGGSGYQDLHEDLTLANVSSWEQFGLAFCGDRDIGGNYFPIYGASLGKNTPDVRTGAMTKFLRQYFRYVALGAVRIGASSVEAPFEPVAFRNTNGKHVVVVKANAAGSFSVGGLPAGTYGIDYTTADEYMRALPDVSIGAGQTIATAIPAVGALTIFAR